MKELETGDTIEIKDVNLQKILKDCNQRKGAIKIMIVDLSGTSLQIGKEMMSILEENKPEIKDYEYSYNHDTHLITIHYKK